MKRLAWNILRTLFGVGLLVAVVVWLGPAKILESFSGLRPAPLIAALATQVLAKLIWTYRWQTLLRANGIERGFWDLFCVVHIGLFFNTFLPTGVGGDLVRGYYVSVGREQMVTSYLTVFIERILGMSTFAALAATGSAIALATGATPLPRRLLVSVLVLGLAVGGAGVLTFTWNGWVGLLRKLPIPERWLDDLERGLALFRRPETPRFAILSSSLALKLIAVLLYILCGKAIGLELSPIVYLLVVPAAVLASMLPVTLNGLGVREGVMVALLTAFGAPRAEAGALALLGLAVVTSFALLGGVIYAFYRKPEVVGPQAES